MTIRSAPACRAVSICCVERIPPPTMRGMDRELATVLIVEGDIACAAPLPASKYTNFMPNSCAASAVESIVCGSFSERGCVWLTRSTDVCFPPSMSM